jgi:hypothetical protein
MVVFSVGDRAAEVEIISGSLILQASPTVINSTRLITLTLVSGGGVPQPGFALSGTCTSTGGALVGLQGGPGTTDANGQTTVTITAGNVDQIGSAGGGSCEFSTADGSATATVEVIGQDICTLGFSPPPSGCPDSNVMQQTLTVNLAGACAGSVGSTPSGVTCSKLAGGATQTCATMFDNGTNVTLIAAPAAGQPDAIFSGECVPGAANRATSSMTGPRTCTVTFNP